MVDRTQMTKRSWCYDNNITIYPVPSKELYTVTKMVYGKKKKVSLPKCRVEVNLDGHKKLGTELWEQDDEMYNYIDKLYEYYYDRANN